ncbi:MAG: transposase [Pedobacter sp.]|uniref:transposase n=1 Tax=Pedobacter sp. TaxID=1411316 RepID=UPI002807ED21|nr:transposase [Pedobacter sp.]MDQ8004684.1 transposase [Pedobacter sp.]
MPNKFDRRSIRLKGYDYSKEGLYFVTVCCQNIAHRFGKVVNGQMVLNAAGLMVDRWIKELENKFPDIQIDEYVIMPNHIHLIIENIGLNNASAVRVDLCVDPHDNIMRPAEGEHKGSPLHNVVRWLKTMTTNYYIQGVKTLGWEPFDKKIWHRNYYEHIIRDERAYNNIAQYIKNNPLKWNEDKFYG